MLRSALQSAARRHCVQNSSLSVRQMSFFSKFTNQVKEELAKLEKNEAIQEVVKETAEKSKEAREEFEKRAKEQREAFEAAMREVREQAEAEANKSEYVKGAKSKFFDPLNQAKSKVLGDTSGAKETLVETFYEVFGMGKKKSVEETLTSSLSEKKATKPVENTEDEEAEPYSGTTAVVVVKGEQSAWDRIGARLKETPIIQGLLEAARLAAETKAGQTLGSSAKVAKDKLGDTAEDAREYWETSQNPWVYRLSSIYDGLFGETAESIAIREIRRADPSFNVEEWKDQVADTVVPFVLDAFLKGNSRDLKKWMGEAAYNTVNMSIRERKADGLVVDPNVLAIRDVTVIALSAEDKQAPIIGIQLMAQQINCIRNREGEIIEGAEDEIKANFYVFAFRREYDEEEMALRWKIIEFGVIGSVPYI
ncbi:Mitochondrial Protein Translocase (MPT) Family [Thraustotheca clavata]|uniref:Mitochondrial Protein Translocase (MPT) Family n=1 Tax=Thraustotheca clavata TaxID=74557 RepID=A0A1V9Y814_9STRA|nr:Mitochondrial Protein Translocase (MPT) Family [Thraustotheca clavata]